VDTDVQLCSNTPSANTARSVPWSTVFAAGEIDLASAPRLVADVLAASRPAGVGVAVDFTDGEFIDVAGVNALVQACNQLRSRGADLVVRSPSDRLRWMLELFGLSQLIEMVGGQGAAHGPC
jgi:anti-sigma B factor antagonist